MSMALDAAYYVVLAFFNGFVRGRIFLHGEMPWAKLFWKPYFNKI
jgi:hypothetical protein